MENIKRFDLGNGVNFTYIPNSKFKTIQLSICMFYPLGNETASQNAIIPNLLTHSCKKFPSLVSLSKKMEELYGVSISAGTEKFGDMQMIEISTQSIDNKFVPDGSDNTFEVTKLLCDMIFEPNTENERFKDENIELEKRQLKEEILAEMNDKKFFARKRCTQIMCKNEKFGISTLGEIEDVDKINSESAVAAWKNLLSRSHIEIMLVGNGAYTKIADEFKARFENVTRTNVFEYSSEVFPAKSVPEEITEHKNIVQCKLVLGLKTKNKDEKINYPAMKVMNALLGGTPQSKLFVNVREKLSLCYYCASRYLKQKRIMLIESGVEEKNVQKAKEQILEQLKDIKLGNFSDSDLENTKLFITQGLGKIGDSLSAIGSWYLSQSIEKDIISPEEHIEEISKITREEVITAANQIALDTVYILSGKGE